MINRPTLDQLFRKYKSDKASVDTFGRPVGAYPTHTCHDYGAVYEPLLALWRDVPITLLELGFAGGASARAWREYFPKATIVSIDNRDLANDIDGVDLHIGSQDDPAFLSGVHDTYGDFDVIVDDASHVSSLTIRSWEILYPWLKPGGLYIVEDTHSSYHDFHYHDDANEDPAKPCVNGTPTAIQYFKSVADCVNFRGEGEWDLFPRKYWPGYNLESVEFRFNLVILRKSQMVDDDSR